MNKKLTKKQAYKILKKRYGIIEYGMHIQCLCCHIPQKLKKDWCEYWEKINTKNDVYISSNFPITCEEASIGSLTRLLMLHAFVEDCYD